MVYNKRPHYESTYIKLAEYFDITEAELKESLKQERKVLIEKKRISTLINNTQ
tara:strand:- start:189 stop:347 length:159 start_codon:yes stop_codon:yes gene_type:complete